MTATAHAVKMGADLPCCCFLLVMEPFQGRGEAYLLARLVLLDEGKEPAKADEHNGDSAGTVGGVALVRKEALGLAVHQEDIAIGTGDPVWPSADGVEEVHHGRQEGQRDDGISHQQAEHHIDELEVRGWFRHVCCVVVAVRRGAVAVWLGREELCPFGGVHRVLEAGGGDNGVYVRQGLMYGPRAKDAGWALFVGEMQVRLGISNQPRDEWQGVGHELGGG